MVSQLGKPIWLSKVVEQIGIAVWLGKMADHPYQEDMDTEMDNDKDKDIRYKTRLQESDRDR